MTTEKNIKNLSKKQLEKSLKTLKAEIRRREADELDLIWTPELILEVDRIKKVYDKLIEDLIEERTTVVEIPFSYTLETDGSEIRIYPDPCKNAAFYDLAIDQVQKCKLIKTLKECWNKVQEDIKRCSKKYKIGEDVLWEKIEPE